MYGLLRTNSLTNVSVSAVYARRVNLMFTKDYVLAVLSQDGKVVKESDKGDTVIPTNNFIIRLRNKHRLACAVDITVDGLSIMDKGRIILMGNDYVDLLGFIDKDRFTVPTKGKQTIDAKFYLQEEDIEDSCGVSKRPIYTQDKEGDIPKATWYPTEWYRIVQSDRKLIGVADTKVFTEHGEIPLSSVIDSTSDVSHLVSGGAITSTQDIYSPTLGIHQIKFEKEPTVLKITIKSK